MTIRDLEVRGLKLREELLDLLYSQAGAVIFATEEAYLAFLKGWIDAEEKIIHALESASRSDYTRWDGVA